MDEKQAKRLEERCVARAVRRAEHFSIELASDRRDSSSLAPNERPRRHARSELAVQAQHELIGLLIVREEPRDVDAVDLVGARRREDGVPVDAIRGRPYEPEEA